MALIIIDMQTAYHCSHDAAPGVVKAIKRAWRNKEQIINVTLGSTMVLPEVMEVLNKIPSVVHISKTHGDGSAELTRLFEEKGWNRFRQFKVCGVNTDACVWNTLNGMTKVRPEAFNKPITVLGKACAPNGVNNSSLRGLEKMKGVTVKYP